MIGFLKNGVRKMYEIKYVEDWFKALEYRKETEKWLVMKYTKLAKHIHNKCKYNIYGSSNHDYSNVILEYTSIKKSKDKFIVKYCLFFIQLVEFVNEKMILEFMNLNYPNLQFIGISFEKNEFNRSRKEFVFVFEEIIF